MYIYFPGKSYPISSRFQNLFVVAGDEALHEDEALQGWQWKSCHYVNLCFSDAGVEGMVTYKAMARKGNEEVARSQ